MRYGCYVFRMRLAFRSWQSGLLALAIASAVACSYQVEQDEGTTRSAQGELAPACGRPKFTDATDAAKARSKARGVQPGVPNITCADTVACHGVSAAGQLAPKQ